MNKVIETETSRTIFLSDNIVLIHVFPNVIIGADGCRETHKRITEYCSCDYGMIVERTSDYTVAPLEVFSVLNNLSSLRAIAIVTSKGSSKTLSEIYKGLTQKPLQEFTGIDEARTWLNEQLVIVEALA